MSLTTAVSGAIDTYGKRAIEAWLAEDFNTVCDTYWHVYEFADAPDGNPDGVTCGVRFLPLRLWPSPLKWFADALYVT